MSRTLAATLLLILSGCLPVAADPISEESSEAWQTALDLRIVDQVLQSYLELNPDAEFPAEWVDLGKFSQTFSRMLRSRLPLRDGWGEEFLVRDLHGRFVVVSRGPNGVLDLTGQLDPDNFSLGYRRGDLGRVQVDEIILFVGRGLVNGPRTVQMHQLATMADLRSIGTAIEAYAVDNNVYPETSNGLHTLEVVVSTLSPVYIRTLPMKDSWGNHFLFWSSQSSYVIISTGADSILDNDYGVDAGMIEDGVMVGAFADPRVDIVFSDGQFKQWPEGTQQ